MNHYETIILGGGSGGYCAALSLAEKGKNVAIVEKNKLGGACLHEGCIPTKSLLHSAKYLQGKPDFSFINDKKNNDILKLYKGLSARIKRANVTVIEGLGKVVSQKNENIIEVNGKYYTFDNLIIATGSSNKRLDIEGLDNAIKNGKAVYSDGFLRLDSIPNRVVIIGGGVIGIEFASYISMLGKEVTILEYQEQILKDILDEDVRNIYMKELNDRGVQIITDVHVQEIDDSNIVYKLNGDYNEYETDLIVLSCGRIANINDIGLSSIGIKMEQGFICVDSRCKTNIENIYACGDVIGKTMLAHAAYKEAEIVVANICGEADEMAYSSIPSVIYSNPEAATVGFGEDYCKKNNIPCYIKKTSMLYSSRYMIEYGECTGICKLIFRDTGELIGAQLIGNNSSEIIFSLGDMIASKFTEDEIKKKIYPHPSFVEIIKETINLNYS